MLIEFTDKGLYCPQGKFYIDPWKPVEKAVITHGHSDHAYFGHQSYLCHTFTKPILQLRLGNNHYETIEWNEPVFINGVRVSLHPAGHIIGSSQIRVEYNGEVWVVSGDYKTENDGISGEFEVVKCNTFITESTFGLPIYHWKPQEEIFEDIRKWIGDNRTENRTSILIAYSLGKAQRLLKVAADSSENIFAHGAVYNMMEALRGIIDIPEIKRVTSDTPKQVLQQSVVLAPPGADGSLWLKRFVPYSIGVCSGWMQVRGNVRRRNVDAGFAMSDHADWAGLLQTVKATGAEKVFVTHGFQSAFSRYLNEIGIPAAEVKTEYGEETAEQKEGVEE
ncbi:MAG TPA: ligase-associated DNA damage response exonuclease [Chitinophagaceae bacterium]|nr:ligase-associated DNA damage response exonuclease [Chitinophagaceae bacterium]